jgi:hypothetical protein
MVISRKCKLVDFLTGHIGPSNCVHYLSVKCSLLFEGVVQSLLNLCPRDVCPLQILIEPHTNQVYGSN